MTSDSVMVRDAVRRAIHVFRGVNDVRLSVPKGMRLSPNRSAKSCFSGWQLSRLSGRGI